MEVVTIAARQFLLFTHLLAFAFAIVTVVREDLALFNARRVDGAKLKSTGHMIAWLLGLLWITGLSLVALKGGGVAAFSEPKIAAKLTVVLLLTANGVLLHWVAFPLLTQPQKRPQRAAIICCLLGSISTMTWFYAAFVGVGHVIAPLLDYLGFMALYAAGLVGVIGIGLAVVRPRIERILRPGRSYGVLASRDAVAHSLMLPEPIGDGMLVDRSAG